MGWTILLKPKFWLIAVMLALGVSSAVMALRVKILTLERDKAQAAKVVAEGEVKAIRRESILITESLQRARAADEERHEFYRENEKAIERARSAGGGDDDLGVMRDTARRLRDRYNQVSADRNS